MEVNYTVSFYVKAVIAVQQSQTKWTLWEKTLIEEKELFLKTMVEEKELFLMRKIQIARKLEQLCIQLHLVTWPQK